MSNLEIFDKDGNPLHVADVIYNYMKHLSNKHNMYVDDVYLGFDDSTWNINKAPSIYSVKITNNGYDANDVESFGDEDAIKIHSI